MHQENCDLCWTRSAVVSDNIEIIITLTGAPLYYYVRVVICNLNATSRNVVLKIGTKRGWDNLFAQKKCWSKFNLCISFSVAVKVQPYVPEDVSPQQQGRRRPMTRPVVQCTWSTLYISRRRKPGKGRWRPRPGWPDGCSTSSWSTVRPPHPTWRPRLK